MRTAVWIAAALTTSLQTAAAADIKLDDFDQQRRQGYVSIHGPIARGDWEAFASISIGIRQQFPGARIAVVSLNSSGGNVLESAKLAGGITGERALTMVAPGSVCASACVLMFVAGSSKMVSSDGSIEVHRVSGPDGVESDISKAMTTEIAELYQRFHVPPDIIGRLVTTPPWQTYKLTNHDLAGLGATVIPRQ